LDPWVWVLSGGEDHALVATFSGAPPRGWRVIGTVIDPVPQAAHPLLSLVPGSLTPGNYFVQVAWRNANGEEGRPSEQTAIAVSSGNTLSVQAIDPPANAVTWNVYAGAASEVRAIAHKLVGSSATCGMTLVVPCLRKLEAQAEAAVLRDAAATLEEVQQSFDQTREFIAHYLQTLPVAAPNKETEDNKYF
jgi:HPt (histidine-containing phosphotransfer) domain-containing protein